jgi:hypothetical protein
VTPVGIAMELTFSICLPADLLQVQHQPEWPAANTLLKRFANALGTERCLKSSDGSVRLMSIDFLGQLVQQLCADSKQAEAQEQWLQQYMNLLGESQWRMPSCASVHCYDQLSAALLPCLAYALEYNADLLHAYI